MRIDLTARRYSSGPPPGVRDLWLCSSPLRQYSLATSGTCVIGLSCVPFDVVGGLGDEESLRVAVKFEFRSRIDRNARLSAVLVASLDRNQQKIQFNETEPAHGDRTPRHSSATTAIINVYIL